ncbi:unnamed protein product [Dracunculus medinensis]|uniref:Zinc finger CCCH domain-containing protein 14 n=1 Tax=Dracunculus medinensis TaxID=318479 RepID=A0A0N4URS1_DRAME|nr:unnamed protein product [Dracunculus medinensis]
MTGPNNVEVSKRIRAAIKAKLEELGVYVDEELPDYIMVMIANKKERNHMKHDLLLFLSNNTSAFVDWLFDTLERLQSAAIAPHHVEKSSSKTSSLESGTRKETTVTWEILQSMKHGDSEKRYEYKEEKEMKTKKANKESEKRKSRECKDSDREAKVVKSKVFIFPQTIFLFMNYQPSNKEKSSRRRTHERIEYSSAERSLRNRHSSLRDNDNKITISNKQKVIADDKYGNSESDSKKRINKSTSKKESVSDTSTKSERNLACGYAGQNFTSNNEVMTSRKRKSLYLKSSAYTSPFESESDEQVVDIDSENDLCNKKVQSSAVARLPKTTTPKTVVSQVVVKRKIPEKDNSKQARGGKMLFLKAIEEANATTRIPSHFGTGTASHSRAVGESKPVTTRIPSHLGTGSISHFRAVGESKPVSNLAVEEEAIEIDIYDDLDLLPEADKYDMSCSIDKSPLGCFSEEEADHNSCAKKRKLESVECVKKEGNFVITLQGSDRRVSKIPDGSDLSTNTQLKTRRQRNGNPNSAFLNLSSVMKQTSAVSECFTSGVRRRDEIVMEYSTTENSDNDKNNEVQQANESGLEVDEFISAVSKSSENTPLWDGQIQLEEEDSSDDEAAIDAVLASMNAAVAQTEVKAKSFGINNEKLMERCKFWPKCRLGDSCLYIHPCRPCRLNSSVDNLPESSSIVSANTSLNALIPCKYGGNCTNAQCIYKHPKACRFGIYCTSSNCYFRHPNQFSTSRSPSSVDKYKWKAPTDPNIFTDPIVD